MQRGRAKKKLTGDFGRILRSHRERLGVTLNELARKIEVDQGLLSKIERGKRPPPQIVPHVQRIAAALGFADGSAELKELLEAAYRERFAQKWPGGIALVNLEDGVPVLTHKPLPPRGLEGYAPAETREIIQPDSPLARRLGLRPDQDVAADGAQPRQDADACSFGLAPVVPLSAWLHQMLAAFGATITGLTKNDETFNLEFRLPDGRDWQMTVSPKSRPPEDPS